MKTKKTNSHCHRADASDEGRIVTPRLFRILVIFDVVAGTILLYLKHKIATKTLLCQQSEDHNGRVWYWGFFKETVLP